MASVTHELAQPSTSPAPDGRPVPPPAQLPVDWRLSRWRGGRVLIFAMALAVVGEGQREYDAFFGWTVLAMATPVLLLGLWMVVFPGSIHLDAGGLRRGRKRWAWTEVASFRLGDQRWFADVVFSTYRLPATDEEAHWLRVGSVEPDVIEFPASVAGIPPRRALALLNHYRAQAGHASPSSTAPGWKA